MYGALAELGIEKGKRFNPNGRMKTIVENAAKKAIYGPDGPAFDRTWKPGDFELLK
jgi:hypothetical protein